jgi:hypothetical protein
MTKQPKKTELRVKQPDAIENLGAAISRALDEAPVSDVLSILTGAFVALTVELVRRQGHDVSQKIEVDGGPERDVTIHAPKAQRMEAASPIPHE